VYLNLNDIDNDTTNIIVYEAIKKRLIFIPFVIGVISGHLFLGTNWKIFPDKNLVGFMDNEALVLVILLIISVLLYFASKKIKTRSKLFLTLLMLAGLLYGHFFWSMKNKNYTNEKTSILVEK
jgi:ABC-type enterochelin transport system permease subunit